jgi:hypothetical protein
VEDDYKGTLVNWSNIIHNHSSGNTRNSAQLDTLGDISSVEHEDSVEIRIDAEKKDSVERRLNVEEKEDSVGSSDDQQICGAQKGCRNSGQDAQHEL